jgi:hypothetical protein
MATEVIQPVVNNVDHYVLTIRVDKPVSVKQIPAVKNEKGEVLEEATEESMIQDYAASQICEAACSCLRDQCRTEMRKENQATMIAEASAPIKGALALVAGS